MRPLKNGEVGKADDPLLRAGDEVAIVIERDGPDLIGLSQADIPAILPPNCVIQLVLISFHAPNSTAKLGQSRRAVVRDRRKAYIESPLHAVVIWGADLRERRCIYPIDVSVLQVTDIKVTYAAAC